MEIMYKKILISVFSAVLTLSCGQLRENPAPEIRYELSGGAGHYNYAPSFIRDRYGIIYGFICENRDPFEIVDYVYLYKGIPTADGYVWQRGTQIVAPSEDGWDDCHICDPDVREFRTQYKGETYDWIMTYLGVDQWDCKHNQIGLAVAKNIEGPYIKFELNPLIGYEGRDKWGVGQSTSIVLDENTIRIFYHSTTENGPFCMRDIVLSDLENIVIGEEKKVPNLSGNSYIAASRTHLYSASEIRIDMDSQIPTWVGNYCQLLSTPKDSDICSVENVWKEIGLVSPELSGFPRNHNPGLLTDTKGYIENDREIVMYFTPAVVGEDWLWSYDLYSATFKF